MSKKVSTQPYKGARDFYPEDKQFQQWMFGKWKRVVERYGYQEYDAPILEPTDLYLMKGSEEIVQEQTYTFKDRGDRSVTIRTEMTPTVSRMVAGRRQELAYPVRWYSIPNLWRYERMQKGRLREFWQLNIDMFGIASEYAELEMIQIVDDIFQAFRAKRSTYVMKLNSRVLVNTMLAEICGDDKNMPTQLIRLIDRMNKMSDGDFAQAVWNIVQDDTKKDAVLGLLKARQLADLPEELQQLPSVKNLDTILRSCKGQGITNVEFDISLMRGFDYYTDIVFEAFDTGGENNRSILGGGRYDGLVAQFGVDAVPTVGFAVGDVVFADFLRTYGLVPSMKPSTEAIMIVREDVSPNDAQSAARELREMGVNVAVDYSGRKTDKQFKSALKTGVKWAIFIGAEEAESGQYILKDLQSNKEQVHSLARTASIVKDQRR